jgi:hypothetical protein
VRTFVCITLIDDSNMVDNQQRKLVKSGGGRAAADENCSDDGNANTGGEGGGRGGGEVGGDVSTQGANFGSRVGTSSNKERKGLQKYLLNGATGSSAAAAGGGETGSGTCAGNGVGWAADARGGDTANINDKRSDGNKGGGSGSGSGSSSLAALARSGKLQNTHSLLDLEV